MTGAMQAPARSAARTPSRKAPQRLPFFSFKDCGRPMNLLQSRIKRSIIAKPKAMKSRARIARKYQRSYQVPKLPPKKIATAPSVP